MSSRIPALAFTLLAAVSVLLVGWVTPVGAELVYDSSFPSGSDPRGIAINDTSGDVYVADRSGNRVLQFTASGVFIRSWGAGVNQTTGEDICTAVSGDTCQAGSSSSVAGGFSKPQGIAVDNSGGPAAGSVYVQDAANSRIQRFDPDGTFVLMWGKGVNLSTGGNICTAASGNTCKGGLPSGDADAEPPIPSTNGAFAGWGDKPGNEQQTANVTVDGAGYVYVGEPYSVPYPRVQRFNADGTFAGQAAAPNDVPGEKAIRDEVSVAASPSGEIYVSDSAFTASSIRVFSQPDFTTAGVSAEYDRKFAFKELPVHVAVDPTNEYLFSFNGGQTHCGGLPNGLYVQEYHPSGEIVDCTKTTQMSGGKALAVSAAHKLYLAVGSEVHIFDVPISKAPEVGLQKAGAVTSSTAAIEAFVSGNLAATDVMVEYGPEPCSSSPCEVTSSQAFIPTVPARVATVNLKGLTPDETYYYRLIATNNFGSSTGADRSFSTFAEPSFDPTCPNNLARQQTGASMLLDCRAYELVSAEDTGGYNVESDLVPGQTPFGGFPEASDRALYAIHAGGIPGTGKPTNRGPDPYVATRDPDNRRWNTRYVGIPADAPSAEPFSSTMAGADSELSVFAFAGSEICAPCFDDGTAGIPLRNGAGELVQGMAGSLEVAEPEPAGDVKRPISADGRHFVFGSKQLFEPEGNESGTDVTIYSRNLSTDSTEVVSTMPNGSTIANGDGVAQLDISPDGSRNVIGSLVGTDAGGNRYWHLYMHTAGSPESVDVSPGTTTGVRYAGMSADGDLVYFATPDPLTGDDTDSSSDLFLATVAGGSATLSRASVGEGGTGDTDACDPSANSYNTADWNAVPGGPTDCSIVPAGGGGGKASEGGAVYFLSPETLDGNGASGAPNLFWTEPGESPTFVATLQSSADAPLEQAWAQIRSFGAFNNPEGVAFDEQSESTYVLDTGETFLEPGIYVQKFNPDGSEDAAFGVNSKLDGSNSGSPFLGFGGAAGFGQPAGLPAEIAVDNNSASPNYRDLFAIDLATGVKRFDSSGEYEALIPAGNAGGFEFPTGLAIDPTTNNIYVSVFSLFGGSSTVYVFDSSGSPVAPTSFAVPGNALGIDIDTSGNVYIANASSTRLYDTSGVFQSVFSPSQSLGVSVDPASGHVFINEGNKITEFESSGTPVGDPIAAGTLSESVGIAALDGRLRVSNRGSGKALVLEKQTASLTTYDNPFVLDSVREPDTRRTRGFQATPDGSRAIFTSSLQPTGFDSEGHEEVFRYDANTDELVCVSCNPTGSGPTTEAALAQNGLSLTDDGRIFFTSGEQLSLRDSNGKKDVYEWKDGATELISTGTSPTDSGLLSVSADGRDAFFFTRERLVSGDRSGNLMKLYDARVDGGFFEIAPPPPCAAADECHGPGSTAPGPLAINTVTRKEGNASTEGRRCNAKKLSQRARRLARRAKSLRKRSRRASGKSARSLRRKTRATTRASKRNRRAASRCLRQSRRSK